MMRTRPDLCEYDGLNRFAFILLWIFIFCVPWEDEVVIAGNLAISHPVGFGAAIAGIAACLWSGRVRKPGSLHYVLGGLVVWAALSYFWSIDPDMTAVRIGSYVQLLFMVWMIWEFASTDERQVSLFAAYVLGTYVSAFSTIYAYVTGTGDNIGLAVGRYTAHGSNENELSVLIALSFPMSIYLLSRRKGPSLLWLGHLLVCMTAILLTGSRGGFISGTLAIMLAVTFARVSRGQKILGIVVLSLLGIAAFFLVPESSWDRVGSIQSELTEGTLTKRTYIWSAGLDVFREHPILGVGAGAFAASVSNKLDIAYVAHNSYLSVLVETGIIGEILFFTLLAALLYSALCLPRLESRLCTILLMTWGVAVLSVTWEHRKPTWFIFGMLIAQAAIVRQRQAVIEPGSARAVPAAGVTIPSFAPSARVPVHLFREL